MAGEKTFYGKENLDRTAYGACAVVAGCFIFLLIVGITFLWNAAGFVRRHQLLVLPGLPTSSSNFVNDVTNQIENQTTQTLSDQKKAAEESASKAVQNQVQNQVQQQTDNLKNAAGEQLQKNLNQ